MNLIGVGALLAALSLPPGIRPDPRPKPDPSACAEARQRGQTLLGCPRPEGADGRLEAASPPPPPSGRPEQRGPSPN